ncbi:mediator of RNA polymerase II transcription subunit 1-domain-containing protein [Lipomyces oligophaga]|uniref:mediator of RNA polymerase II transcription subunit 1-domain-containing protein n=1 Tax=Lipomyces oligophaga TaxID=45792 RepID=UPI0034CF0AB2
MIGSKRPKTTAKNEIQTVIDMIRQRPGAISESGIERLAKSYGLEVFKEDTKDGKRISLGGRIVLVDIDMIFPARKIVKVTMSLANALSADMAQEQAAVDGILLADLQSPTLDRFAKNLDRIARQDRLSTAQIDNFHAVATLYLTALTKIYKHELEVGRDAENEGHGKPIMNGDGVVGLSILYWTDRHRVPSSKSNRYRVLVEIDESTGSRGVVQTNAYLDPEFDLAAKPTMWQEPDYTGLEDQVAGYVLVLDPPVAVPFYDAAILDPSSELSSEISKSTTSTNNPLYSSRTVFDSAGNSILYRFSLAASPAADMQIVDRIYISHPRQIYSVFEILRQSLFTQSLLSSVFAPRWLTPPPSPSTYPSLSDFLSTSVPSQVAPSKVSIKLQTLYGQPSKLSMIIPTKSFTSAPASTALLTSFTALIQRNALVKCTSLSVNEQSEFANKSQLESSIENVLQTAEDLGIMAHWLREQ